MSSIHKPDVAIIGAGPGGYVAAIRLAQLGQKVLLVEQNKTMGGVCLNRGCIPSKALIYAGSLYEKMKHAGDMGILLSNEPTIDLPKMMDWKDGIVNKLTGGVAQLLKANGVQTLTGRAEFNGPHKLSVKTPNGNIEQVEAKSYLIATGSSPIDIPGFKRDGKVIIDSTDALSLQDVPKKLALIGGGVIGLELGILYAKLGTEVTVVEMMDQLLPGTDKDVVQVLTRSLKKRKIKVFTESKAQPVQVKGKTATLTIERPKGTEVIKDLDKVLVAVGRKPNSQSMGLEKAGVKVDDRGFIQVDHQLRTSVRHIFAIGDVTSAPLLAHKASKEGLVAAEVIAGNTHEVLDVRAMPSAVFTDPEIATVGLTEEQAKAEGYTLRIGTFPFAASGRAMSMNKTEGLVKMIVDGNTDQILGVHMIGPEVSELIAEVTLAIEMGATAEDIALTVHAHPTLPESIMEAAESVHGKAVHIYQKEKPPLVGAK